MYSADTGLLRQDMQQSKVHEWDIHRAAVPHYSQAEHQTWAQLMANQRSVLPGRACQAFMAGLEMIDFPLDHIPRLADISDRIERLTGWKLVRVDGVVPDEDFFELLAARRFPSTDFIRKPEELGYTPAPDMFHDLLGHVPLLTNPRFCAFFERFGQVGIKAFRLNHPAREWLPRLYWYTVEFGLIKQPDGLGIYGAGILSSPSEVLFSLSDKTSKSPFDISTISQEPYDIWHMQQRLFVIDSFEQLESSFARWSDSLF